MEVRTVDAIALEHTLGENRKFGGTRGQTSKRTATIVRAETANGLIGWGEAFAPPRSVATLVEETISDSIIGSDPLIAESLAERVYSGDIAGYHFGSSGLIQAALSGVETALWDLRGKEHGAPVHELLSGQRTESLLPYASTMYITEREQDPAEPILNALDEGFTGAKIKIGRSIDDDIERTATAREHLGDDAHLMVDYNGNYTPAQAIRSINAIEKYDITWAEEPVPPENLSGYQAIQHRTDVPLAAGEAHFGRFQFKRLIDERCVDIIQPNLGRCGGFAEARFLTKLATTENIAVRPHVWNSAVGTAAAVQFAASIPDYPHNSEMVPEPMLFEFDRSENPLRDKLLTDPLDPTGGTLQVPQKPGLGITVDENMIDQFRIN